MKYIWAFIAYLALLAGAVTSCGGKGTTVTGAGANTGSTGNAVGGGTGNSTASGMGGGGSTGIGLTTVGSGGGSMAGSGGSCPTATTCAAQGANCGTISNGCNGTLDCGTCGPGMACGISMPNVCGQACTPKTCQGLGYDCGATGDGCGGMLDCGTCMTGQSCGANNMPNVCGVGMCTPATCQSLGYDCGMAGDGCGGTLNCGTCGTNQACGVTSPNVCGNSCTPKTCAELGYNCGPAADGCGNLISCGNCTGSQSCGGGGMPNVCGTSTSCTGLCLQQQTCSNPNVTTTLTGTVYSPNGVDPLYGALVFIPNGTVQAFPCGVTCGSCSSAVSGNPLVSAVTGVNGQFTLTNVPVGANIPLVIQLGRWRRQVTIANVPSCVTTAVPKTLTNMPSCRTGNAACPAGKAKGDIPLMAFATGSVDGLECVMEKIGVDQSEFTVPAANCGGGRIHIYTGITDADQGFSMGGATIGGTGEPTEDQLWGSQTTLNYYDMVLFPCQGDQNLTLPVSGQQHVVNYANAGGRIFATHFSYDWLFNISPFSGTADWAINGTDPFEDPQTGYINQTFPEGSALAQWLQLIGASTTLGQIQIGVLRHDFTGVVAPSELWINLENDLFDGNAPMHMTFNTPVGAQPANQCGKVVYDDFHVEDLESMPVSTTTPFPEECDFVPCTSALDCLSDPNYVTGETCTAGLCMTPQEKLLEFMLFDLASCIPTQTGGNCTPKTCAEEGINCGPAGDGCGNVIQCGNCAAGETCGGGGMPSVCGTPPCTPKTCQELGAGCGTQGDGCGGMLNCGTCAAGLTCGGGGTAGQCGNTCTPKTCAGLGYNCGMAGDGCGGTLNCGTCAAGLICGYNKANVCGSPNSQ